MNSAFFFVCLFSLNAMRQKPLVRCNNIPIYIPIPFMNVPFVVTNQINISVPLIFLVYVIIQIIY